MAGCIFCCMTSIIVWYFDAVKFPTQGIVGKRKALMKSIELREKRKRKREELEVVIKCTSFTVCVCI